MRLLGHVILGLVTLALQPVPLPRLSTFLFAYAVPMFMSEQSALLSVSTMLVVVHSSILYLCLGCLFLGFCPLYV